jgi:hypothetical protein
MPGATRLFLAGNAVAMTGNGLVIAFTGHSAGIPPGLRAARGMQAGEGEVFICTQDHDQRQRSLRRTAVTERN